ncbi:MAG: hypothetical protein Aureis2KO_23820 [Aureisphaera sp.]
MMEPIRHLYPLNKSKAFFAAVLTLFALYIAVEEGLLYGFILLGIGAKLAMRQGIELDLTGLAKYRKINSLFGWAIGSWKILPEIEYISVFKTKKKTRTRGVSAEATIDSIVYKVNLFHNTNQHIEVFMSDEKEAAFRMAEQLKETLQCEIHDAT